MRGLGHELANFLDAACVGRVVDDDFVVVVHHNLKPRLGDLVHGMNQKITGDSLDNVLHQLPTVGFQASPLPASGYSAVCDGGASKPVLHEAGFHLRQTPTEWELDEEDPGHRSELQLPELYRLAGRHANDGSFINISTQLHNIRVGCPPRIHQWFKLCLFDPMSNAP